MIRRLDVVVVALVATSVLLAPCDTHAETGDPVDVAVMFFEASKAWRCDEVWRSYSAGTRENFLAAEHRYERERDGPPRADTPQKLYCGWKASTLKRGSARIVRQQGDTAVVAAEFSAKVQRHRYDFIFAPTVVGTEELRLVREAGTWRVEQPRIPIGREGARLIEVGPVDVFQDPCIPGLHCKLEATAVSRVPRHSLDSALRDPTIWARVLPSVSAAEPLEHTGDAERIQLTFAAEAERSLTVVVNRPDRPLEPTTAWTAVQWSVEDGNKAPVYIRGWWNLRPHHDGTRVTMTVVLDPKQWSGGAVEGAFSAEWMAQALFDLDTAALE